MAKIVDTWALSPAGVRYAAACQEFPVERIDRRYMPRAAAHVREEVRACRSAAKLLVKSLQTLHQADRRRNLAVLAEFGFAQPQHTALKIHVADLQVQGLAHPQTAAVEQTEHLGHDQMAQWRMPAGFDVVGHMKHPPYFGVSQDPGREAAVSSFRHEMTVRNVRGIALFDHEDGESTKRVTTIAMV